MRKGYKVLLALTVLLLGFISTYAQVPCSGDPDDPGYDPNGCPAPLDTWVMLLAAIAIYFGYRHLGKTKRSLSAL
ncbi:hypothetical protein HQ865_14745 [Mucilaginibacter mali]|uniref:Uncharacterized protein n=1 Tax=Mucilaginibacter mali TaxID=2740462 RepID=A0A7D4TPT9_9SPHI|nr:hypothetical protein [Mucilaginibacter mali]QKJ30954.1 hypothetical protein HQ865_14745 [Mucilaginibacter mali]